jgi:hypothetical protein
VLIGSDGRSLIIGANGGTSAAQTGDVRLDNAAAIAWRKLGAAADITGITVGSDNVVYVGDSTNAAELDLRSPATIDLDFATGSNPAFRFSPTLFNANAANIGQPSGGYQQWGGGASGVGAGNTYVVDPSNIATVLSALPSDGGTLLLRPGLYGTVAVTQSTGSRVTLTAQADGGAPSFGGPQPVLTLSWSPTGTPSLTVSGCALQGSPNAASASSAGTGAECTLRNCVVLSGTIAMRSGTVILTLDNTDAQNVWAAALTLKNGSKIRGNIMGGTTTSVSMSQFLSPAATVFTSVGTFALDPYSLDFFGAARGKLGGSGPLRAVAGPQFGGVLGNADAPIFGPSGTIWQIPGTNTADRTYTFSPVGSSDLQMLMIENRDSSSFAKIIATQTGTPSGTVATLTSQMGHIFQHVANLGLSLVGRYPLV